MCRLHRSLEGETMTRIEPQALSEIEALMQERQKYEKWINSLGERRGITPSHVFQRVLSDYEGRMRAVAADLSGRAAEIEASMNYLNDRLAQVQKEEETTADERAEAELRAVVGEYSNDKWEEIRKLADENIARLGALRMELSGELSHLGAILKVAAPMPAVDDSAAATRQPVITESLPVIELTTGSKSGDSEAQRAPRSRPDSPVFVASQRGGKDDSFDELAFLSSVVENEISQLPSQPVDLPRAGRISQDGVSERSAAVAGSSPSSSKGARSATPLISESINSGSDGDESSTRVGEEPNRAMFEKRLSGSVPAYLKDVSKEASKSLKCQECGTMNYPTEWYCERCGGELAAL
jgi:hypothetical protein